MERIASFASRDVTDATEPGDEWTECQGHRMKGVQRHCKTLLAVRTSVGRPELEDSNDR